MISTKDKTLLLPLECGELFHAVSAFVLFSRTEGGASLVENSCCGEFYWYSVADINCSVVHN